MASDRSNAQRFKIEGSGQMLNALAEAIEQALREARSKPDRRGTGSIRRGSVTIEVEATNYDRYGQGQNSGRSDKTIIEHKSRGLELLLFYRIDADELFRY
jgi:hypothetical protein